MILPIIAYGDAILRKETVEIEEDYPQLNTLISNMYETMYNANGIGLAAPQIGLALRLFVVDSKRVLENAELEEGEEIEEEGITQTFINAEIIETTGKPWAYTEGCLSIPDINEDVTRAEQIRIQYYDENFKFHDDVYDGITARVILHEYDHIEGKLFVDYLSGLRKRLLKRRLEKISKGEINAKYKMRFPKIKKKRR